MLPTDGNLGTEADERAKLGLCVAQSARLTFRSESWIVWIPNNHGVSLWPFSKDALCLSPVTEAENDDDQRFEYPP